MNRLKRREILSAAAVAGTPLILPNLSLGKPNDKLNVAMVGSGWMDMNFFSI